jgi:hypothetical protein
MRTNMTRWPRLPALYGSALGFGGAIVATIVSATGALLDPLSGPVLAIVAVSAVTTVFGALATALQAWLLYAGFLVGSAGEVAFTATTAVAAVILVASAGVATVGGAVVRWAQRPRPVRVRVPVSRMDFVKNAGLSR